MALGCLVVAVTGLSLTVAAALAIDPALAAGRRALARLARLAGGWS